jgi:FTR1 family protein
VLPTFVIGLREGLEAALIVGIVAAFLAQQGRRDALRWVWIGVAAAAVLCFGVGVLLRIAGEELPRKEQEGLETVIAIVAVGFVTWMIVWMKQHARTLSSDLRSSAAAALATGSAFGLVAMAFLAVLREGLETAVFLVAAFNASGNTTSAAAGAVLGLVIAIGIGAGIYKGGISLNLTKFFKFTGVLLAFVAAGLLSRALHTAHEAGWFDVLQARAVDLTSIIKPGSIIASLWNGIIGLTSEPTVGELGVYLIYLIPVVAFVVAKPRASKPVAEGDKPRREFSATAIASTLVAALAIALVGVAVFAGTDKTPSSVASSNENGTKVIDVQLSDAGCVPADVKASAGPTTFKVTNTGTSSVTEYEVVQNGQILGEAENVAPGIGGSFSLTLSAGEYDLVCPGGKTSAKGTLTVTGGGTANSSADDEAVADYRKFLEAQTTELSARTAEFTAAVEAGDLAKTKALFARTRAPYEQIEPVAEAFGTLDPKIDARVNDVAPGDQWTGFHRIEKAAFKDNTLKGMGPYAKQLTSDVADLVARVKTVKLEPAQIGNGAVGLLGEVSKSKITGEEDRYSHTDLVDFQANVDGAKAAFDSLHTILGDRDAALTAQIDGAFDATYAALKPFQEGDGYVSYLKLTAADKRTLSQTIDRLAEPLSKVPALVVVAAQEQSSSPADKAVSDYRKYLQQQTKLLSTRTAAFTAAIEAGDLAKTKALFASTRQPYEAIEPVAEAFGDLDPKIDARVNDVEPGAKWTGFHRIEKAAFKDGSLKGMTPYAKQLSTDIADLVEKVGTVKLEPAQIGNGAVGLLGEVSKSKITGEEDRYSHTDLADFKGNVDGAKAAFDALHTILGDRDPAITKQIDDAFDATYAALKPFESGDSYVSYTKLTAADKRTLSQTIDRLAEPLSKVPALVVVAAQEQSASPADVAVSQYRKYLEQQTALLSTRTAAFTAAVESGDLAKTKSLFAQTRLPYEAIEPVAEAFGDLDPKIDARVNDVEPGTKWTGFHRIEKAAFKDGSLDGMTPIAQQLSTDVADLVEKVRTVKLEPAQIANGAVGLLGEVSKSKITGEEDRYSHTDLVDFKGNVDGAKAAFSAVRPILGDRDADLTQQIDDAFTATYASLKPFEQDGGYVPFTDLTATDKRSLSQTIDRLAEPLSKVPALVVA